MPAEKKAPVDAGEWKELFSTVNKFLDAEPWALFENTDVFFVISPEDNQPYLCCVMGGPRRRSISSAFHFLYGTMSLPTTACL